jgi:hypothetical protein
METTVKRPTLEEKLQAIRRWLRKGARSAWEIGNEVNQIRRYHLAAQGGFRSLRHCLEKEFGKEKRPALYRYARVAKFFSAETVDEFGLHRLDALQAYQKRVHGQVTGPDGCEIQLPQADGSVSRKKFEDCSLREITRSATREEKLEESRWLEKADLLSCGCAGSS